jgi:type I restriction enzyme S subunit
MGMPYITGASNFERDSLIINRWTTMPKVIAVKGDLLVTCKGTVGEMLICEQDECHIARQIMAVRNVCGLDTVFLRYTLSFQLQKIPEAARGIIPGISREDLLDLELPCPPLAEQRRIVGMITALYRILDEISSNIA